MSAPAAPDDGTFLGLSMASLMSNALLFLLISGMAGSCDARELGRKFVSKDARGILAGVLCQYGILPALGFLSLQLFPQHTDPTIAVTLLLVTTSPGGGFSGVWCSLSNADLALSVAMTTASTIACIAALPLNVYIYVKAMYPGMDVAISFNELMVGVIVVVLAVIFGSAMSFQFQDANFRQGMNTLGSAAGVCLMVLGGASNAVSKDPIWENPPSWFACIALPCIFGLVAAFFVSKLIKLESPAQVAVAIECCYQNTGLALTIALSAVPPSEVGKAAGVPLFYGLVEMAIIPIFAIAAWKAGLTYADKDLPIWQALLINHQPDSTLREGGPAPAPEPSWAGGPAPAPAQERLSGDDHIGFSTRRLVKGDQNSTSRKTVDPRPLHMMLAGKKGPWDKDNFFRVGDTKDKDKGVPYQKLREDAMELIDKYEKTELGVQTNLESARHPMVAGKVVPHVTKIHSLSPLEILCSDDKGLNFKHHSPIAVKARYKQTEAIKHMLIREAALPYKLPDEMPGSEHAQAFALAHHTSIHARRLTLRPAVSRLCSQLSTCFVKATSSCGIKTQRCS